MQYELYLTGDKYLFVSQQSILLFVCICLHFFSRSTFSYLVLVLLYFLKQHLETVRKHWVFRKWDSAVQETQIFGSNMSANSKILLGIMKATLTSLKSLFNGQRIKADNTMQSKCVCAWKRSDIWREPNFMSRWKFETLILVLGNSLATVQYFMKTIH